MTYGTCFLGFDRGLINGVSRKAWCRASGTFASTLHELGSAVLNARLVRVTLTQVYFHTCYDSAKYRLCDHRLP